MAPGVSCNEVTRIDQAKSAFIRSCFQSIASPENARAAELEVQSDTESITSGYFTSSFESSGEERRIQPTGEKITRLWERWDELAKNRKRITSSTPKSEGQRKRVYTSVPDVSARTLIDNVTTDELFRSTSTPVIEGYRKRACKRVPERKRRLSIKTTFGNSTIEKSTLRDEENRNRTDKPVGNNNLTVNTINVRNMDITNSAGIDTKVRKSSSNKHSGKTSNDKQKGKSSKKTDGNRSTLRIKKNIGQRSIVNDSDFLEITYDRVIMNTDSNANSNYKQGLASSSGSQQRLSNSPTCLKDTAIPRRSQDVKMPTKTSTSDSCVKSTTNAANEDCLILYDPEPIVIATPERTHSKINNYFIDSSINVPAANYPTPRSADTATADDKCKMYNSEGLHIASHVNVRLAEIRPLTTSRSSINTSPESSASSRTSLTSNTCSSVSLASPPSYLLPSSFGTSACRDMPPSRSNDWKRRPVVSTSGSDLVRLLGEPTAPSVRACTDREHGTAPSVRACTDREPTATLARAYKDRKPTVPSVRAGNNLVTNTKLRSGARYHPSQQHQPILDNTKLTSGDQVSRCCSGCYSDGRSVDESMTEFLETVNKDNLASLLEFYDIVTEKAYEKRQRSLFKYDVLYC